MTTRDQVLAVLGYQAYDRLPLVHFGFWRTRDSVLHRWQAEGHIDAETAKGWSDGNLHDRDITAALGFDCNWQAMFHPDHGLRPGFESRVLEVLADGGRKVMNSSGVVVLQKDDAGSIPMEFDHLFKGRTEWEEQFGPRLEFSPERVEHAMVPTSDGPRRFCEGGLDFLRRHDRVNPCGLHCGSLYGVIRSWLGLEQASLLLYDDEELFVEIIDTVAELCFRCTEYALSAGAAYDYGHFWEDIAFKNGPLLSPLVFARRVGPHYRRITALLREHGIDVVSVDCDGFIDSLVPVWLENGVNTMFPIEVGTWHASIAPWRRQFGRALLGVGGMNKHIFARDEAAVDQEIARLKELVDLGGYLPCPDHRIADDAEWDMVRYYCLRMREEFG